MNRYPAILFITWTVIAGCSRSKQSLDTPIDPKKISYAMVDQSVFKPRCAACHMGTVNKFQCDCYVHVKEKIDDIARVALKEKSMPKGGSLSDFEAKLLSDWIAAGAPENAGEVPPPEEPLKPNFTSIKKKIFDSRCIACHSPGQPGQAVPLNTKDDLINSPRDLVLPGDSKESGLIIALIRKDDKRMPPPEDGAPLKPEEIAVIAQWIDTGTAN